MKIGKVLLAMFALCSLCFSTTTPDAVLQTPAVQAQLVTLYKRASLTYMNSDHHEEYSFTVKANGAPNEITSSESFNSNVVVVKSSDTAIVHTHPATCKPQPSPGDIQVAQRSGVPNYELSRDALYVAMPDGTVRKVGNVNLKHGVLEIK